MVREASIYFWRPTGPYGYLGQWWPSMFTDMAADGTMIEYSNAEQYMMHRKGLLFAPDSEATHAVLATLDPKAIKALGREVPNFDVAVWERHRSDIVVRGNLLKFSQDPDLRRLLLETGEAELVEASPLDRIWGVGFAPCKAAANRPCWGLNLLGKALMEVRDQLRGEAALQPGEGATAAPVAATAGLGNAAAGPAPVTVVPAAATAGPAPAVARVKKSAKAGRVSGRREAQAGALGGEARGAGGKTGRLQGGKKQKRGSR